MPLTCFRRGAVAVVVAMTLAASLSARVQEETENFDKTVPFPSGGTLALDNFSGAVHITGTTGKDVVIKAVRRATRDRLDHIKLDVQTTGSTVRIEANKRDRDWEDRNNNVVDTTFEIQVPAAARLNIKVFSSDVDVKGVSGELDLDTFSGEIIIDASAAGASPSVNAKTFSGDITARLADSAKGDVRFKSFSGSFNSDLPISMRSASRGRDVSVSGSLPAGSGNTLAFETFSGNLQIKK